ncbi:MAG: N-methyl-D-aspartate receptor NMDAR2C subunit [Burkholderiales bacterium]|nr:N-methyl-D-aspartate receptor NMDAR2C subunit [Burkholderiales bacterium]
MESDDLQKKWNATWGRLGLRPAGDSLFQQLLAGYSGPGRFYHNVQHLVECLDKLEGLALPEDARGPIELALWFHDAIYDVHRHDNEERSAQWAAGSLLKAGAPSALAEAVSQLILATRHAAEPQDDNAKIVVDVDLSILAASEERFAEYERQIRQEYDHVPSAVFTMKRKKVLQGFLDRRQIYSTANFHARFEERARQNIKAALADYPDL